MGAAQSTTEHQQQQSQETHNLNQQVIERLRALELQNKQRRQDVASQPEKGYVIVPRADGELYCG